MIRGRAGGLTTTAAKMRLEEENITETEKTRKDWQEGWKLWAENVNHYSQRGPSSKFSRIMPARNFFASARRVR